VLFFLCFFLDFLFFFTFDSTGVSPSLSFVSPSSLSGASVGTVVVDDPDFFRSSSSESVFVFSCLRFFFSLRARL